MSKIPENECDVKPTEAKKRRIGLLFVLHLMASFEDFLQDGDCESASAEEGTISLGIALPQ